VTIITSVPVPPRAISSARDPSHEERRRVLVLGATVLDQTVAVDAILRLVPQPG
jgi:hypothetical protein